MYDIDRYNTNFITEVSVFFKAGSKNTDEFVVIQTSAEKRGNSTRK